MIPQQNNQSSFTLNPYKRFKAHSFSEKHLVIKAPNKWYKMTPEEIFTHNIGPGIYNDFVRSFLSRAGLGFTLGLTWFDKHHNPAMAIGHQMANMVGARVGLAVGGLTGGRIAGGVAKLASKKIFGSRLGPGVIGNIGRVGGLLGAGLGMMAFGAVADATFDKIDEMSNVGKGLMAPDLGYGYKETRGAVTARQRSLMAMKTSRFNVRSILGNEAYRLATGF